MIIGVPKEIKEQENRVALTPGGVATLGAAIGLHDRRGRRALVEHLVRDVAELRRREGMSGPEEFALRKVRQRESEES